MVALTKPELTKILAEWLKEFLRKKFSDDFNISVIIPDRSLSKLEDNRLKKIPNISFFEFNPDMLGILENKKTKAIELILLNKELKSFSLKEIGEMQCYCRISKPKLALMASLQGLVPQIDRLINHNKKHNIIDFDREKIKIFRWDTDRGGIDLLSVTPLEEREFFK